MLGPKSPRRDEAGLPKSLMTFDTLKMAQALHDRQALMDAGRQVLRLHLGWLICTANG